MVLTMFEPLKFNCTQKMQKSQSNIFLACMKKPRARSGDVIWNHGEKLHWEKNKLKLKRIFSSETYETGTY